MCSFNKVVTIPVQIIPVKTHNKYLLIDTEKRELHIFQVS